MLDKHDKRHKMRFENMRICSIIVLYNPDISGTNALVKKMLSQVEHVYLIDNSMHNYESYFSDNNVSYIFLKGNKGIAAAQNIGIKECIKAKYEYIIFSDQDSMIPDDTVKGLIQSLNLLESRDIKVGSIGTKAINKETGIPYTLGCNLIQENIFSNITEVTYTMNSISLFKSSYFKDIGLMDEKLFIDGVDSEICWRGATKNYRFFINNNIEIQHLLGLGSKKVGNKYISLTPPKRMYYQYRNFLYLRKKRYVPKKWVRANRKKYFEKILYYPLMFSPRCLYIKYITLGIIDGIKMNHNIKQ